MTAALVAFGVVNFPDALLLLRLNEIGFSVVEVILAYVGYNAVYALSSYRRACSPTAFRGPPCSESAWCSSPIGYIGLGLTTDTVAAWLLIGVYGLFTGCTDGVGKAWISSLVGSDAAGQRAGRVPGAQRFRGVGRRSVGGLAVGRRRPYCLVGLGRRRCGVRGRAARRGPALRTGTATSTASRQRAARRRR